MSFVRALVSPDGKIPQISRAGVGFLANPIVYENDADSDLTLTISILAGGFISQTTELTQDRTYTTATAAAMVDAWPEMDLGDAIVFEISTGHVGDFDIVLTGGVGVTDKSTLNVVFQASRTYVLVKTGAATYDLW